MALHDMWSYDHAPQSATDISAGSSLTTYPANGTYNTYTGYPGILYKNTGGTANIGTDGYLYLTSSSSWNPSLLVKTSDMQNWSTSSQYWIGFRTKTTLQNVSTCKMFAMADSLSQANVSTILSESDMTAANAATVNVEYYVEIFIDRTNLVFQVWINGLQVKTGTLTAASVQSTGYYFWGAMNSVGSTAGATRCMRDFYFMDVDATDTTRLGPIRSSLAPISAVNAPNYSVYSGILVGSAGVSATQSKFGGSSLSVPNTSSYLTTPASPAGRLLGDFTIEYYHYITSTASQVPLSRQGGNTWFLYSGANILIYDDGASGQILNAASAITLNTWQHIALVRQGTTWTLYVNGVSKASVTSSQLFWTSPTLPIYIGNNSALQYPVAGYMDELRISNIARYTAAFTPPVAAFTMDANTLLLMHFDNSLNGAISDEAGNALTAMQTAYSAPPGTVPNAVSAVTNDTLTSTFTSGVAGSSKIVAVDYRFAALATSAAGLGVALNGGSGNQNQPNYTFPDTNTMQYGRRAVLARNAADGTSWTPAKISATSLLMTPYTPNTALLMHFDGVNGGTVFTDAAGNPVSIGGGSPTTWTTQSKFGGSSFNPNGGYLTVPDTSGLEFSGDFTVEFFNYFPAVSGNNVFINKGGILVQYASGWYVYNAAGTTMASAVAPSSLIAGQWQHIAVVKKSGVWSLYVAGTSVWSATNAGTFGTNSSPLIIGANAGGGSPMSGYMDELRISNIARYSANFTPPTQAFTLD